MRELTSKKLLDLGFLATAGKWSSNCVKRRGQPSLSQVQFYLPVSSKEYQAVVSFRVESHISDAKY